MKFLSYTTLTVLTVDLLATSGDITMTWTSPMYSKLYSNDSSINPLPRPITAEEDAYIASLINIGAMVGGIPFSFISDHFGRKVALLGIGIVHIIAYLSMAFAKTVDIFYFGRAFGGLAVGAGYTLLPLYIAEVAKEEDRGLYSMTMTVFWALGNFMPYLVGPFLSGRMFNLFNAAFPIAFFILFLLLGIETPFYLVGANKMDEAEKVLMVLRSQDEKGVQTELNHIKDTLKQEEETPPSFKNIFINPGIRKAFIISIALMSFQQFSGWNAIFFYLQPIFEASGTMLPSYISSMIVGASIMIFSLPAPYFADKFGRKTLLICSSTLMAICLFMLGSFFYFENRTNFNIEPIAWLPITSLLIMVFAFENGMACLPWTVSSELFPKNFKKISASTTSAACWFASFLMTQFFNDMTDVFGKDGTFLFYGMFSLGCGVFTWFYIPETRGKTFIEIQQLLQK
ncbi:unnamed protein product [Psylliodes chrysocephalus]|uniref:Major facilitator superfamily (MFS) profile domain-containing protein n=1 Tax=Psylliodes chrysocephalus TaxID=3402493 RepID=A0A9P0GG96_9CUCU|nr:unnamed protein product [Psylliodes chrysocephala]